jgi:hypothetical protein
LLCFNQFDLDYIDKSNSDSKLNFINVTDTINLVFPMSPDDLMSKERQRLAVTLAIDNCLERVTKEKMSK